MNTSAKRMYDWNSISWRKLEKGVFKLQKRIYQASCRDDRKAVHKLQRLLIHSRSAAILAVRRVAQDNQGKRTAGVDGLASLTKARSSATSSTSPISIQPSHGWQELRSTSPLTV